MRKISGKIFALVLAVCVVVSTAMISVVSVSAASGTKTIDLITEEKNAANAYNIAKDNGNDSFSVKNAADLAVGEVAYNGPSSTVYYASIGNAVKKDGMAIDFGENIDVSEVTDGKESKYKIDMWLWIENAEKMDTLVFRFFEPMTYKNYVKVEKLENCGEYRLCNKNIETYVTGWNHIVFTLPEFGLTTNQYENEAYTNFRNSDTAKTVRAMTIFGFGEGTSDYALASLRITNDSQLATDYPDEFGSEEGDANDLTASDESDESSETLIDKIASTQVKKYVTSISKGAIVDLTGYTAEVQQTVIDACTEAGYDTILEGGKLYLKGSDLAKQAGVDSGFPMWIIFVIIGVVVVIAVVIVVIVVANGKKKKAAAAAPAPAEVKDEESDDESDDEKEDKE